MPRTLPAGIVHCVMSSPPYWRLRDYSTDGQLGLEATPRSTSPPWSTCSARCAASCAADGTRWLTLGDSYATGDFDAQRGYA